jgi:hypothetical protein
LPRIIWKLPHTLGRVSDKDDYQAEDRRFKSC